MRSPLGAIGALLGFLAVALGAFGGHALSDYLSPERMQTWQTAARYQIVHAVALIAIAAALEHRTTRAIAAAGWLFVIGTVLFSGSLYVFVLTGMRLLGAITPFGGAMLMTGWLCLAVGFARRD